MPPDPGEVTEEPLALSRTAAFRSTAGPDSSGSPPPASAAARVVAFAAADGDKGVSILSGLGFGVVWVIFFSVQSHTPELGI